MTPRAKRIIAEVAEKHGIEARDIIETSRYKPIVAARHEVFFRLCNDLGYSAERIATLLHRDSSSVRYGIGRHAVTTGAQSRLSVGVYTIRLEMSRAYNEQQRCGANV